MWRDFGGTGVTFHYLALFHLVNAVSPVRFLGAIELNGRVHHCFANQRVVALFFAERAVFRAKKGHGFLIHFLGHFHARGNGRGSADIDTGRHDYMVAGVGDKRTGGYGAAAGDEGDCRNRRAQNGISDIHGGIHPSSIGVDDKHDRLGAFRLFIYGPFHQHADTVENITFNGAECDKAGFPGGDFRKKVKITRKK
ncbi:MAG: hypothetical protein BWY09_01851 [Candidatus Hydrogenedentes bacterium ADurb.Bin179]|nr:MAG: hypothetical protein BWY09_01851 [Candidatus Hydrogenedentes bacterium ADurb.Bin179]